MTIDDNKNSHYSLIANEMVTLQKLSSAYIASEGEIAVKSHARISLLYPLMSSTMSGFDLYVKNIYNPVLRNLDLN
jgi:hypothetical protein